MMVGLFPTPPLAYWDNVPWWAFFGMVLVIAVFASPFAVQVLRGRTIKYASDRDALSSSRDGLERERTEFLRELQQSLREAQDTLRRERADWEIERARIEEDRDVGWDLGRGMEDQAHAFRHLANNLVMRFNGLLDLTISFVAGQMEFERLAALTQQIAPIAEPPPVPRLREVKRLSASNSHAPN